MAVSVHRWASRGRLRLRCRLRRRSHRPRLDRGGRRRHSADLGWCRALAAVTTTRSRRVRGGAPLVRCRRRSQGAGRDRRAQHHRAVRRGGAGPQCPAPAAATGPARRALRDAPIPGRGGVATPRDRHRPGLGSPLRAGSSRPGPCRRRCRARAGMAQGVRRVQRGRLARQLRRARPSVTGRTHHPPDSLSSGMTRRVYIETYGCQMNVADSELMLGLLARDGYERTDEPAEADVILVNTCAVRDNAEQRVVGRVGELQRHKRPGVVLGVVGCMAQRLGPILLERVPRVDLVVGPDAYRNLPQLVDEAQAGRRTIDTEFRYWEQYEDVPTVREPSPRAFVTVQRGCDYKCTFCIVPYTRGPERSRKLADVVREVAELAGRGTTEVTLLGQTVNS